MKIRNVIHKGLRRFIEDNDASALPATVMPKVRKIVDFLQDMERESELLAVPIWKAQDRKSTRLNSSHHAISRMPSSA